MFARRLLSTLSVVLFLLTSTLLTAQGRRWTINGGAGVTPVVGDIGKRLNTGYNLTAGAGYNVNRYFIIGGQFLWNGFGVNRAYLAANNVPGGDANVWAVTAQPTLRLAPQRKISPYVVGGVGYYRRTVHFTQPTLAQVFIYDPFFFGFGGFGFPALVPANQILKTVVRDGIGGNLGAGFEIGLGERFYRAHVFAEARYHYANTGAIITRMVPVTFGLRF